ALVAVEETTHSADPVQPFDKPNPGAQLEVTATIGDINEDTNDVRMDLTVTNPNDDNARVLTRARATVQLKPHARKHDGKPHTHASRWPRYYMDCGCNRGTTNNCYSRHRYSQDSTARASRRVEHVGSR